MAVSESTDSGRQKALGELLETYWLPVYAFIRRSGYDADRAHDLTQGFFVTVLERGIIERADRERGRFRTYLLVAVKGFLKNELRHANAMKRGGGSMSISIDASKAEERLAIEPSVDIPPDREFERQWAMTVLRQALHQLEAEFVRRDRAELFVATKHLLTGEDNDESYRELSETLGMSENALKVSVHRMRKRYRELIRLEVGHTVSGADELQSELDELLKALN